MGETSSTVRSALTIIVDRYEGAYMFPPPPALPIRGTQRKEGESEERESRLRPINVHFTKSGQQLVASYLVHGIV